MKGYKYCIAALCFYFIVIISCSMTLSFATETRYGIKAMGEGIDSGLGGVAAGFCIITASLKLNASFLYKHFED